MKTALASTILGFSFLCLPLAIAAPLQPQPDSKHGKATLADRDHNRLSDSLQSRLDSLAPSEPVAVVITFSAPGNSESAQHAVGPFQVKRHFSSINGLAATMTVGQVRALSRAPGVSRVEEDFRVTTMLDAANRDFGATAARGTFGATGAGVGICIVDTGVDPAHEQLDSGKVAGFVDFVHGQTTPYDDHGHGTHVAAIAAGDGIGGVNAVSFKGVAPGAKIYAAKVLDAQGSGAASDVIAGVEWCAAQAGTKIISMSLGSEGSSDGADALSLAVNAAVASGKVAVVAAGNSGDGVETVGSPGAAAQAITVGAVAEWSAPAIAPNHSDGMFLAWFSGRGPTADGRIKPDLAAPGVSITSAAAGTGNGYVTWSGTSMATPFVAGTLALALESTGGPTYGAPALKNLLMSTAQDRGPTGVDNDWGAGLLDVKAFLAATRDTPTEPTPFPNWNRLSGSVADNGLWIGTIEVTDTSLPLAVSLSIAGQPECSLWLTPGWCWAYEWSPDLDAELVAPNGTTVLRTSTCPAGSECGSMGRQETLHILPPQTGTYQVRVYPYADAPNNGKGGNFALDISTGPLANTGGGTLNQQPVANAGPDQSVVDSDGNGSQNVALTGSGSDSDGIVVSYAWAEGATQIATGATPTVSLGVGIHTLMLTVTDDDGASATDTVVVTVLAANPQPGAFSLLSPINGATNIARAPTFDWSDSAGATSYTIVVDNNRNFSSPVFSQVGLTASNHTSTVTLGSRTTYYWKVTAVNAAGTTQSAVFKFKTTR